jgi:hypothetical protein
MKVQHRNENHLNFTKGFKLYQTSTMRVNSKKPKSMAAKNAERQEKLWET